MVSIGVGRARTPRKPGPPIKSKKFPPTSLHILKSATSFKSGAYAEFARPKRKTAAASILQNERNRYAMSISLHCIYIRCRRWLGSELVYARQLIPMSALLKSAIHAQCKIRLRACYSGEVLQWSHPRNVFSMWRF